MLPSHLTTLPHLDRELEPHASIPCSKETLPPTGEQIHFNIHLYLKTRYLIERFYGEYGFTEVRAWTSLLGIWSFAAALLEHNFSDQYKNDFVFY